MKTAKTKPLAQGSQRFALNDAKLAVDIAALRDQLSKLGADLRYVSGAKPQAVLARLEDAQRALGDALGLALTVEKS